MTTSEQVNELSTALAKAQGTMSGAKKDAENPHFRSKYADLASIWDACRKPLTDNGLSVVQSPRMTLLDGGVFAVELETRLMHTSGQWIADFLTVPVGKADAQGVGSAVTYARRYALASFVGVAPDDDDGNAAVKGASEPVKVAPPAGFDDWATDLAVTADDGEVALREAWTKSAPAMRTHMTRFHNQKWDALKAKAAKVKA